MSRRVIAAWIAAAWAAAVGTAVAQPAEPAPAEPAPTPPADLPPEPAAPSPVEPAPAPAPAAEPAAPAAPPADTAAPAATDEIPDQLLGGSIGLAGGGRTTPGGLRITGHYLYQLSDTDWFDGIASFTFGGGGAACFRDRQDDLLCDHGPASGGAVEVIAAVRRMFAAQGRFRPFVRAGIGAAITRFSDDDLTGASLLLHAGGGLRAAVGAGVAIVVGADLAAGAGTFSRGIGGEPQLGLAVTAGAELRLR